MSTNCLVTKLKAVVNNSRLEPLGSLIFTMRAGSGGSALINTGFSSSSMPAENLTVEIIEGNAYLSTGSNNLGQKYTFNGNPDTCIILSDASEAVKIKVDKYALKRLCRSGAELKIEDFDIRSLSYTTSLGYLQLNYSMGDIDLSVLKQSPITYFDYDGAVSIQDIKNNLPNIKQLRLTNSKITGSLTDFASLVNLTQLYIFGTAISGDWKDLVAGMIANGKTSGEMYTQNSVNFTFNGTTLDGILYTVLTWDSTSIIVRTASYESTKKAWCYNCTQAQKDALTAQGYTVVEV